MTKFARGFYTTHEKGHSNTAFLMKKCHKHKVIFTLFYNLILMKRIFASLLTCCLCSAAWAQYNIYPVPQQMTPVEGTASFSGDVCLVCDPTIDIPTRNRALQVLNDHGLKGNFTDGEQNCTSVIYLKVDPKVAVAGKFDAHTLELNAMSNGMAALTITGQHTDATFMGLASLEQMLDECGTSALPCVRIDDYADQQQRGLVEGYYGYPYSVEVKKDLMRFMMRMKMNSYMYGAKSDPYHLSRWTEPYPTKVSATEEKNGWLSQDMVRDICETSTATKVNFIWSIHPGNNFINSATVINDIMAKYQKMYDLGVRQFGLFVDDVSIPKEQADMDLNAQRVTDLQHAIEARWNTPEALPADTVKPLNFVPQIYCRSFAGSDTQYENFFRALASTPSNVIIYTTGWGVWSVPNAGDFNMPKKFLGRDVAWWWNYPCNDNADSQIYPMDMYQNFNDMPAVGNNSTLPKEMGAGIGIVSNPMQQGEVAKIPLFSVADYAWNNSGFDNKKSWAAAFPFILADPDKAQALKTLAPHLTKNDPSGKFPASSDAKTTNNINELLDAIATVRTFADSEVESERLLWLDLQPWVLKLEQMLHSAEFLMAARSGNDRDARWEMYTNGAAIVGELESNADFISYTLEGMYATTGSPHITQPSEKFLRNYLTTLRKSAVKDLVPTASTKATAFTNTGYAPSVTNNATEAYIALAPKTYQPGQYVGFALPAPQHVTEILAADTLVSNYAVLVSPNGRDWQRLESNGADTRSFEDYVKYVVVGNNSNEPRSIKVTKACLRLALQSAPKMTGITAPVEKDHNERNNIFDDDVTTYWAPYANQNNGDVIRLNYAAEAPIRKVRFVIHTTNDDYMKTGRIEISSSETSGYKRLSPEGLTKTSFTLADMTPLHNDGTPYTEGQNASEATIYQLYFDAKGQSARYVRFYNQSANTNKWLRIAEFYPIFDITASPNDDCPEICDALAYTATFVKAGSTITFDPLTAFPVSQAEVFTSHGIIPITPDADHILRYTCDEDTYIYEVVVSTEKEAPELFGATGISRVLDDASTPEAYDLTGRRIAQPQGKGLYIVGGKKIIF